MHGSRLCWEWYLPYGLASRRRIEVRLFLLISASFLACRCLGVVFRQQDRYEKEPYGLLLLTFALEWRRFQLQY